MVEKTGFQDDNDGKKNNFMYYLTFISSLGGFLFGYDTGLSFLMIKFRLFLLINSSFRKPTFFKL